MLANQVLRNLSSMISWQGVKYISSKIEKHRLFKYMYLFNPLRQVFSGGLDKQHQAVMG